MTRLGPSPFLFRRTEIICRHHATGMQDPSDDPRILSDPFPRRKGQSDHEYGPDEFLDVCVPVFAMFDASGRDTQHNAGRKEVDDVVEDGRCGGNVIFHHG